MEDGTTAYIPIGDFQNLSSEETECNDGNENVDIPKLMSTQNDDGAAILRSDVKSEFYLLLLCHDD